MKKYFYKGFQKIVSPLQKFTVGTYHRAWNLAKRLDPSRMKKDQKK